MTYRRYFTLGAAIALCTGFVGAQGGEGALLETTPHFAFYSDFDTNLNDALVVAGMARNDEAAELFHAGTEQSCFDKLPASQRAGWNRSVDFYAEIISPVPWNRRQQFLLRLDLAGQDELLNERDVGFTAMAENFRKVAAPAYRACRWSQQDTDNRHWTEALRQRLKTHEAAIAERLQTVYATQWHGLPLRVDVVATCPKQGANSITLSPAGGHILVSTSIEEDFALEILFHEASHTIASAYRGDALPAALKEAAGRLEMRLPGDLWHVVLFYMTGDVVRRVLSDAGNANYVPFVAAKNLWGGSWGRYRGAIETILPGYLDGNRSLAEAATRLLETLAVSEVGRE